QRTVNVGRANAGGKRAGRPRDLAIAAQIDHRGDPIGLQRLATGWVEQADVVGPDHDARSRDATTKRKTTEIPGVLTVRPVEVAGRLLRRLRRHLPTASGGVSFA